MYRDLYRLTRTMDQLSAATRSSRVLTSASREIAAATRSSREVAAATRPYRELTAATSIHKELAAATRWDDEIAAATRSSREIAATTAVSREVDAVMRPLRAIETDVARAKRELDSTGLSWEDLAARAVSVSELMKATGAARLDRVSDLMPRPDLDFLPRIHDEIRPALTDARWGDLGRSLSYGTTELAACYQELNIEPQYGDSIFDLPALPALELFAHASLLGELGFLGVAAPAVVDPEEADEEAAIQEEIDQRSQATLESLLASYDPALLSVWLGAVEGLTNQNDSVRHFCVSQRGLLRKLLEKAAPNRAVLEWTENPNHIGQRDTKEPTMSGRFAYLCAQAKLSNYTHFAITDAKAASEIWKLLCKGVKQMPGGMDERKLAALRIRSTCLIVMALQLILKGRPD